MDVPVLKRNFKQLYRDQAQRFYAHILTLASAEAEVCEEIRRKEISVEKAVARNAASNAQLATVTSSLNKCLEDIKKAEQSKMDCVAQLNRQNKKTEDLSARLHDMSQKINQLNQRSEESKDKICRQLQPYRDIMGLTFERVKSDRSLRLIFQFPNSKPCMVTIVHKENSNKIVKCVPMLKDLDQLEAKLSETNDFTGFIIRLHALFRTSI